MYQNTGFTLVELLVVVLIIGILAAVALPQYQKAVNKTRMTNALTLLRSIKDAEERHYLASGEYTLDWDALDLSLPSSCSMKGQSVHCNINGWDVQYSLSTGNFSSPNYYVVGAKIFSPAYLGWQWQLDRAAILPGRRICFPDETNNQMIDLCKGFGGTLCNAYAGWYPGAAQPYCLPD